MFKNHVYDVLKWIALIVLPALATFYFALATIWDLPYPKEIGETITAIDTLLGCLLGVSTVRYNEQKELELEEARRLNAQHSEENNTSQQD